MNIKYALLISLLSGLTTMIGLLFTYIKLDNDKLNKYITLMLSFSFGIMILISIYDLLPKSLIYIIKQKKLLYYLIIILVYIILFYAIKILNKINNKYNSLYKVGVVSLIVLLLHNIPEGIITFLSSINDIDIGYKIVLAIAMHNIPEGITIALPIYYGTKKRVKSVVALIIASLAEPFGAIITYLFLYKYVNQSILSIIYILVGLLMITLSVEQIFPEALSYKKNKYIVIGVLISIVVFFLQTII